MSTEKMQASFRLLMLITTPKLAEKALLLFEKGRLPMQIQAYAHGTASREMMDMLGLDSGEKSLLLTVMPKADADDLLVHCAGSFGWGSPAAALRSPCRCPARTSVCCRWFSSFARKSRGRR